MASNSRRPHGRCFTSLFSYSRELEPGLEVCEEGFDVGPLTGRKTIKNKQTVLLVLDDIGRFQNRQMLGRRLERKTNRIRDVPNRRLTILFKMRQNCQPSPVSNRLENPFVFLHTSQYTPQHPPKPFSNSLELETGWGAVTS